MPLPPCRLCGGHCGTIVLNLGDQPACDHFPPADDPGPDPTYRLQMWLCAECGLAQLVDDPTDPEEPRGVEPAALVQQSLDAVERVAAAGWLRPGTKVAEYGSPHGGSWLKLIADRGLTIAGEHELADVVVDCFGLMHWRDQAAAIAERAKRVAHDGVLLMQYHELRAIVRQGQWNMLGWATTRTIRCPHWSRCSTRVSVFVRELRGRSTCMAVPFYSRRHAMAPLMRPYRGFFGKRKRPVYANPHTSVSSKPAPSLLSTA